jgi:L-2-hydroxycarboxylate dehydrogenase (NAD+)
MTESTDRQHIVFRADELKQLAYDLVLAAGASPDNAEAISSAYLHADLSGVGRQGIDYIPYLLDHLSDGRVNGKAAPKIVRQTEASALIDGGLGPGQTAAKLAAKVVVDKARSVGVGAVGVTNSSDIFMLGYYASLIADAGLIGLVFTSGPPLVHPYGGVERMLGTNPVAMSFPTGDKPLLLDIATSTVSGSSIRHAYYHGEQVAPGIGLNSEGEPTTDAEELYKGGALAPLGGYKGFGLGLCFAMLCGPLTGSAIGPDLSWMKDGGESVGMGHFFMAINPASFGEKDAFSEQAASYIGRIKSSEKSPGIREIRIPGERSAQKREARRVEGVPIVKEGWKIIEKRARDLGVTIPQPIS